MSEQLFNNNLYPYGRDLLLPKEWRAHTPVGVDALGDPIETARGYDTSSTADAVPLSRCGSGTPRL